MENSIKEKIMSENLSKLSAIFICFLVLIITTAWFYKTWIYYDFCINNNSVAKANGRDFQKCSFFKCFLTL